MSWQQGRETVERLLADGELERVSPDLDSARRLLESSGRHLSSARKIREGDPEGAYTPPAAVAISLFAMPSSLSSLR